MNKTSELFDKWNTEKKLIEFSKKKRMIVKRGELWICKIGVNIGSEISKDQNFVRPVLVLKTGVGGDLVNIIPLTSKYHEQYKHQYLALTQYQRYGLRELSYCLLNQARSISIKRLNRKINNITVDNKFIPLVSEQEIKQIRDKISNYMF